MSHDYSVPRQANGNQLDSYLYKLLHAQRVMLTEKCPKQQQSTLVFTGLIVDQYHVDDVLPNKFLQLDNDPQAPATRFKQQHDPLPHVYRMDGLCRSAIHPGLPRCSPIIASIDILGETVIDLRVVTRSFEDAGYLIIVQVEPCNNQSRSEIVRVTVKRPAQSSKAFMLAWIELIPMQTRQQFGRPEPTPLLTSRHRHTLHENNQVTAEYLARPGTRRLFVAEYQSRKKLLAYDSGRPLKKAPVQQHHGDQLYPNHSSANGASITALFLHSWPKCLA